MGLMYVWLSLESPGSGNLLDVLLGLPLAAMFSAIVGLIWGVILGFLSGGATYLVLCPFIPPERWAEMNAALRTGMRRGGLIGQIAAMALPPLVFWILKVKFSTWSGGTADTITLIWLSLVPCGAIFGGFVSVARLMGWRSSTGPN